MGFKKKIILNIKLSSVVTIIAIFFYREFYLMTSASNC